jgi:hypothetical protein
MWSLERLLFVVTLAGICCSASAENNASKRGRIDYVLHCSGCHALDGRGIEAKGIPRLRDQIGYYLTLPEGRAFIMQVPGLLSAGLSDQRAAGVMNWVIEYFAGSSMPPNFVPYTLEEARRYRLSKPADIAATRRALAKLLFAEGYPFK